MLKLTAIVLTLSLGLTAAVLAKCEKTATCDLHDREGKLKGDEILNGVQYCVYEHSTLDRNPDGTIKMHTFRVKCD